MNKAGKRLVQSISGSASQNWGKTPRRPANDLHAIVPAVHYAASSIGYWASVTGPAPAGPAPGFLAGHSAFRRGFAQSIAARPAVQPYLVCLMKLLRLQ